MGALPPSEIDKFIDGLMAKAGGAAAPEQDPVADAIAMAKEAIEAGDTERAGQIYEMIMQQVPGNADAIFGLAAILVDRGRFDDAEQALTQLSDEQQSGEQYDAISKAITMAREAEKLGNLGELETAAAANPDDHQAQIDLAMRQNASGDRIEAAQTLVASIKRDREWNEGAAQRSFLNSLRCGA